MMMPVFSIQRIYWAYHDCRKNKRNKPDALRFEIDAEENLATLCRELSEKTYRPSSSICFVAKKPKLREIFAADFRDRVVHHLLVRPLERIWEPLFIHDSYASRSGKGIHSAAKRLQKFTRQASANGSRQAYYMQLDIRNFFMRIDKTVLLDRVLSRLPDADMAWLAETIIAHEPQRHYRMKSPVQLMYRVPRQKSLFGNPPEKGLPIGNLTSQFLANVYLDALDQFVKHDLKCRRYIRYVDDFVLLDPELNRLLFWKKEIERFLKSRLLLELNPSRTRIRPIGNGIDFVGYIVRPDYLLCRNRVVNNLKSRLFSFKSRLIREKGGCLVVRYDRDSLDALFDCLNSYLGHFKHANTYRLVGRLFEKHDWLGHYFRFQGRRLKRIYKMPRSFRNLKSQYRYFQKVFGQSLIIFQTGAYCEFYGHQARRAMARFGLKQIDGRFGYKLRCGFGKRHLERFVSSAMKIEPSVVLIEQTGYYAGNVMERSVTARYVRLESETS